MSIVIVGGNERIHSSSANALTSVLEMYTKSTVCA